MTVNTLKQGMPATSTRYTYVISHIKSDLVRMCCETEQEVVGLSKCKCFKAKFLNLLYN